MATAQQMLSTLGGASGPVIPAFADTVFAAGLWNWNPVGYDGNNGVDVPDAGGVAFTTASPFALDLGFADSFSPPYLVNTLYDQNAATNNLTAAGSARPTLHVTTPVIVTGIGAGTYTYRGQFNGYAYYNLTGQANSTANYSVAVQDLVGDLTWQIQGAAAAVLATSDQSPLSASFPWQETYNNSTVTAGTGAGQIQFDGLSNGMRGGGALYA